MCCLLYAFDGSQVSLPGHASPPHSEAGVIQGLHSHEQNPVILFGLPSAPRPIHSGPCSLVFADFFLKEIIYLFLVAPGLRCFARALSSCGEQGLLSSCDTWASYCGGFSCCGARAREHMGFSSYGALA